VPKVPDLISGLKMLREVDLNAIRQAAESPFSMSVVGDKGVGKSTLIAQLLSGPQDEEPPGPSSIGEYRLDKYDPHPSHNLVLLMLDARKAEHKRERQLVDKLIANELPVVICYNKSDLMKGGHKFLEKRSSWHSAEVVTIVSIDRETLLKQLVPAMLRTCNENEVQLARHLPIVREDVSHRLIDDTCLINATYSLSTGLAEIVPVLNLPLNVADLLILTKNQTFMAYKITLALGLPPDWRDTIPKLATVVGTAFLWRQLARQLVGLIPAYGIIPKVAIAYAGTYAIGQAIYHWCINGEKLRPEALKALYVEALQRGSEVAQTLVAKGDAAQQEAAERFRDAVLSLSAKSDEVQSQTSGKFRRFARSMATRSKTAQLQVSERIGQLSSVLSVKRSSIQQQASNKFHQLSLQAPLCTTCGKKNQRGAQFCAFCGKPLLQPKDDTVIKKN